MLTWSLFLAVGAAVGAGLAATDGLLLAPPVVAEADMHWWLNYLEQMERAVGRSPDMAHLRALLATTNSRYGALVLWGLGTVFGDQSGNCYSDAGIGSGTRCDSTE